MQPCSSFQIMKIWELNFSVPITAHGVITIMRLWSLHPAYLDAKGLVALWREGLLAQAGTSIIKLAVTATTRS